VADQTEYSKKPPRTTRAKASIDGTWPRAFPSAKIIRFWKEEVRFVSQEAFLPVVVGLI
jgi:hypothetical protein